MRSLTVKTNVATEDGSGSRARIRLSFSVDVSNGILDQVPLSGAIQAAVEEGRKVGTDGKNTAAIKITRDWPELEYHIRNIEVDEGVKFIGKTILTPFAKIVEGVPAFFWTVECVVSHDDIRILSAMVDIGDDLRLETIEPDNPQAELL